MANHSLSRDNLANVVVPRDEANSLVSLLKERIRKFTRMDEVDPEQFADIWRCSRVGFELSRQLKDGAGECCVTSLSREDVESLYALPMDGGQTSFLDSLNAVRSLVRPAGPVDPVVSDAMGKCVVDIMES